MVADWLSNARKLGDKSQGADPEALARLHSSFEQIMAHSPSFSPERSSGNLHKFRPGRRRAVAVAAAALASKQISANALRVAATRGRLQASKAADGTWQYARLGRSA